jgi:hypothetical protein
MRRAVLALVVFAAAACGDARLPGDPIRLIDDPGIKRDAPFLAWGSVVSINDEPRRVLSASQPVTPPAEVVPQPEGGRKVGAQIPPGFSALPWLVFETTVTQDGATTFMRSWPVTARAAGNTYAVWVTEHKMRPGGVPGVRLWPVPDLATRDVETGDVTIPPGSVLQVGVGLEMITWDTTVLPLEMKVTAIADGRETVLSTTPIEIQRREHKRWIDVSTPLDALAGRSVRFRFSTRPKLGPTAVASLPVWAEPTIVPAAAAP